MSSASFAGCAGTTAHRSAREVRAQAAATAAPERERRANEPSDSGWPSLLAAVRVWWQSRLGRRLLQELVLMSGLYFFYKLVRMLTRREVVQALDNAHDVINMERQLGLFTETSLQALVLHNHSVVRFFDTYYVSAHFVLITVTLIALYVSRPEGYFHSRRILLAMTSIALLIHVTYPLAPPRMFPVLGFVDTGQVIGPGAYGHGGTFSGVANQFAAMPSMHFGWALLAAWAVIVYAPSRYRYLIVLHPVLTLLAIVVTANHYWVDAAVAALIFVMVLWSEQRLARPSSNPQLASGPTAPERRIPGLTAKAGEA